MLSRWKNPKLFLALAVLALALALGCAQQSGSGGTQQVSPERAVFTALDTAQQLYTLGMTTAATLRDTKVITMAQYQQIETVAKKFYDSWQVAFKEAQTWASMKPSPDKDSAYAQVERLMAAYSANLTDLTTLVGSFSFQKKK